MRKNFIATSALAGLGLFAAGVSAQAATYSDTFNVDPNSLKCFYYGTTANCTGYQYFNDGARYFTAGDDVTETVQFTGPVSVPGSNSLSSFYVTLPNIKVPFGFEGADGSDKATSTSTLQISRVRPACPADLLL